MKRVDTQNRIETATNNANAAIERVNIAKNYTSVFEKMVSDVGTQANIFATAKVDKSSTLFAKGMQEHEKAFLENKKNMESDLETVNSQRNIANSQSKLTAINQKQNIAMDMLSGVVGSFINYKGYQTNLDMKAQLDKQAETLDKMQKQLERAQNRGI